MRKDRLRTSRFPGCPGHRARREPGVDSLRRTFPDIPAAVKGRRAPVPGGPAGTGLEPLDPVEPGRLRCRSVPIGGQGPQGKTVRIRRGSAAVTGDESRTMPLSRGLGKARRVGRSGSQNTCRWDGNRLDFGDRKGRGFPAAARRRVFGSSPRSPLPRSDPGTNVPVDVRAHELRDRNISGSLFCCDRVLRGGAGDAPFGRRASSGGGFRRSRRLEPLRRFASRLHAPSDHRL